MSKLISGWSGSTTLFALSRELAAPVATVEDIVGTGREDALSRLFDLVENDADCKLMLGNWNANRKVLADLYGFMLRAGAGQLLHGKYVPCFALANPWTLEYLLACRENRRLGLQAAGAVCEFFATGGKDLELLRSNGAEVAIMRGPNRIATSRIYRPYSITALHHREQEMHDRRIRLVRYLRFFGAAVVLAFVLHFIFGGNDARSSLRALGSVLMIAGFALTWTIRWDASSPRAWRRPLTVLGLVSAGFILMKFV